MRKSEHICYVVPHKPTELRDTFIMVFFEQECSQCLEISDVSFEHVPKRVCAQQMEFKV